MDTLAYLLAPKVYLHPQDWSFLADPAKWVNTATVYDSEWNRVNLTETVIKGNQWPFLFNKIYGPRYFASHLWPDYFTRKYTTSELKARIQGDPIVNGKSTAPVYYTFMEPRVINSSLAGGLNVLFHYFYPFNGCSNQEFAMSVDGRFQGIEYYMCGPGLHEGDWEHVSMYLCVGDILAMSNQELSYREVHTHKIIRQLQVGAHSWHPEYNCTKGECPFAKDEFNVTRLSLFSGLFSHAMYATASPLQLYQKVSANFLLNVDGIYIGDRTTSNGPIFQPTKDNIKYVPIPDRMTAAQKDGEFAWAVYPGSWGGFYVEVDAWSVTCFADNFTREAQCSGQNPAYFFMTGVLEKVQQYKDNINDTLWINNLNPSNESTVQDLTGPLFRDYTYIWSLEKPPALYSNGDYDVSCPFTGDPTETSNPDPKFDSLQLSTYLGVITGLLIGSGIVFGIALCFPRLADPDLALVPVAQPTSDGPPTIRYVTVLGASSRSGILKKNSNLGQAPSVTGAKSVTGPHKVEEEEEEAGTALQVLEESMAKYRASRHVVWMVLAICIYTAGLVLACIGIQQAFTALGRVYNLALWDTLRRAFTAVVVLFGSWQVVVMILTFFLRNQTRVALSGRISITNPLAQWGHASIVGARMQAVIAAVVVVEINTTLLLFAFGFLMWVGRTLFQGACCLIRCPLPPPSRVGRTLFQGACSLALTKLFDFSNAFEDLCINLSLIGVDRTLCGSQLTDACSVWSDLYIQYLSYGSLLFVLSHLMFLAMSVHQLSALMHIASMMKIKTNVGSTPSVNKV